MASKQQGVQFPDFDMTKYLGDFKLPGLDVDAIVASQRRNIEALTQANRLAFEGMQEMARRQAELLRQTMDEVANATKAITEPGTAQDKAAKQADLAKDAFERALANMREMAEIVAKSNGEAFELLNKRFADAMEEMRAAITAQSKK